MIRLERLAMVRLTSEVAEFNRFSTRKKPFEYRRSLPHTQFPYAHLRIPTSALVEAKIFSPSFTLSYTVSVLAKKGSFGPLLSRYSLRLS